MRKIPKRRSPRTAEGRRASAPRELVGLPVPTAESARRELSQHANAARAQILTRYFKARPGEYAAGDCFIGLTVPRTREVAREYAELPESQTLKLLRSKVHEERLLALLILERQSARGDNSCRKRIFDLYLRNLRYVNHWDLVDASCRTIVGGYLLTRSRRPLYVLARSKNLWCRRIAIVSTYAFIRAGEVAETLKLAERYLRDSEDLIQKATGWMLREAGNRNPSALADFLAEHAAHMPRTMLRYAIERLAPQERRKFMEMRRADA